MNKKLKILLAAGALLLAVPSAAYAEANVDTQTKVEKDDNGGSKTVTETTKTDDNGTTGKTEETVKVKNNDDGSTEKTHEVNSSVDPKGLFNKTTDKTVDETTTDKDGKVKHHHKKVVNGTTVEEDTEKQ